jgi:hypothetical protein
MKMVKDMENDEKTTTNQSCEENQEIEETNIFSMSSSLSNSEFDYL